MHAEEQILSSRARFNVQSRDQGEKYMWNISNIPSIDDCNERNYVADFQQMKTVY